jgi:hypothetical protein
LEHAAAREDVFQGNVEFAHVILSEAVFIPQDDFQEQALDPDDGEIEGLVPFRVQCLADDGGCFSGVTQRQNEILAGTCVSLDGASGSL